MSSFAISPSVEPVAPGDREAAVAVIVAAFAADPAARWVYPEAHRYLEHFPKFVRAFGGRAFECGTADCVDGCAGAALWISPGVEPDEASLAGVFEETVPDGPLKRDLFQVFDQMDRHHPREPHWYLPMIGVDLHMQNRGLGSVLMERGVRRCDRERAIAYLESSNPRNIPLYERYGFEVIGTIQAGSSPPIRPMVRKPR